MLTGTEVKALRDGNANIGDAYGMVRTARLCCSTRTSHRTSGRHMQSRAAALAQTAAAQEGDPAPDRRGRSAKGLTLVPLELYFKRGQSEGAIALAKGKQLHDKRADLRKKDDEREMARRISARADAPPRSLLAPSRRVPRSTRSPRSRCSTGTRRDAATESKRVEQVAMIRVDSSWPSASAASLGAPRRNVSRYRSLGSTSN